MKVKIENWTIRQIVNAQASIDPKPQYQRGNVWRDKDNMLLIDSIFKGFDIPKIYLRETPIESFYKYEVADGQQRLFAIWGFTQADGYSLDEVQLDDTIYNELTFQNLKQKKELKPIYEAFMRFELTISILKNASDHEVRTLFARLQMGKRLNEAEKRNAVGSSMGYAIDSMIETNSFFLNCKINESRFNRQDFLAHAITLIHFQNEVNLKADAIKKMYEDLYVKYPMKYMKDANKILKYMDKINEACNWKIKNKWAFVDFFWFLYRHLDEIEDIRFTDIGNAFLRFENKRLQYSKYPDVLIESDDKTIHDKPLYEYINAFNLAGNLSDNINTRARVFDNKFRRYLILK